MNARFLPWPAGTTTRRSFSPEAAGMHEAIGALVERACCCPARPVVRVVMPSTTVRRHETDLLLLCGHHSRASREALTAAGAAIYDVV